MVLSIDEADLQDLYLGLLMQASPPVPGRTILSWLLDHHHLWSSTICSRLPQKTFAKGEDGTQALGHTLGCLAHLRGMAFGRWEADRLWVLPAVSGSEMGELAAQAKPWGAALTVGTPREDSGKHRYMQAPSDLFTFRWSCEHRAPEALPSTNQAFHPESPGQLAINVATPVDLMLELIRRTEFNDFEGTVIAEDLVEHADLWRSVVLAISDTVLEEEGVLVHAAPVYNTLESLSDPDEAHAADQLWVLTPGVKAARELVRLSRKRWNVYPNSTRIWNRSNSQIATGCTGDERVVSFWWD